MKAGTGLLLASLVLTVRPCTAQPHELARFITAKGDQLFDGDEPFRFLSFNIPNLHLIEDNFSFTHPNPWRWPNEFEIADALESIRQMGGKVTRMYVLSVARDGSDRGDHVHVRGPGEFNETAFRVLDKVLQIANAKGVRVIIPLVDNWHWWGGRAEYARFRGKAADDFWSDEQIIRDFEKTIDFTLNRVNSLTGVAYKDDPAILGWETGNELDSTAAWTRRISASIKRHDANHLVIDGYALHGVRRASLDDPNIDVLTTHHYPNTDQNYVEAISQAHAMTAGQKPYFVGEFGFSPTAEMGRVIDTIIEKQIAGGLLWSLRSHSRDGGFYWHSEPAGGNLFKAYHWPGFSTGEAYDERGLLQLVRRKAYEINGQAVPPLPRPAAPTLLPIVHASAISWQGSAGADRYEVWRAERREGPWHLVGNDVSDAGVQYRPLFADGEVEIGKAYFYRLQSKNEAGISPPSNRVGPVAIRHQVLVDECRTMEHVFQQTGTVKIVNGDARRVQEDMHRFRISPGSSLVYQVDAAPITNWRVMLFPDPGSAAPEIAWSAAGQAFRACQVERQPIPVGAGDYGYRRPLLLTGSIKQPAARYLRIKLGGQPATRADHSAVEISRVEIDHGVPVEAAADKTVQSQPHGAALNPSILLFHKPRHAAGAEYVRRAAALGSRRVNVVVTLMCEINQAREVLGYGLIRNGKYVRLNEQLLGEFRESVQAVFAEAVARDIDLSVLAHLNAGGKIYDWRNTFQFDPLVQYQGYSYEQALIAPIAAALAATARPDRRVDFSLAGEMGRSVFAHAASYTKLLENLRRQPRLPQLNLGISFNFANVAGADAVAPAGTQAQRLVNACDFVGLSHYRWFDLPIESRDFAGAVEKFLAEMQQHGASIPARMPLHFSEVGIGGGTDTGLAKTPAEAAKTPWHGSDNPRRNPWQSAEMQQFRVEFHRALLSFLARPATANPITEAYLWSEGSWDPLDITDRGFADREIITMIQQHNDAVTAQ